jgi:hypothetical protein
MYSDEIANQLTIIRNSCDVIERINNGGGNGGTVINVKPGDVLQSVIEQALAGSILSIDNAYITSESITVDKPLALIAATPVGAGRISIGARVPQINGKFTHTAPGVSLTSLAINGVNNADFLLTTFDGTIMKQCILTGSQYGQHRAIWADSKNVQIVDSYIANIFESIDCQAIFAYNGCDGLTVDNCYLEASGENILFGGADADSADKLPKNITINNCDITKNLTWQGAPGITVKNLLELKCAINVKMTNCRLSNCWTQGQTGYAIILTVRNQGGTAPFSIVKNVVIDNCQISNVGAGVQFLGRDDSQPSQVMTGVQISNNHFSIDSALGASRQFFISSGPENVLLVNNVFEGANLNSFLSFDNPAFQCPNFEFDGNEFQEGDYGIFGTNASALGQAVLDMYTPGYKCSNNIVHKGTSGRTIQYPSCITVAS